jgi:two-component system phosphate regulon sensor histidine kinase PhoR
VNLFDYVDSAIFLVRQKSEQKEAQIGLFSPEIDKKNVTIEFIASDENKDIKIKAGPRLLDEILFNILENAVKYNKENGKVEVSLYEKENFAVLEVFDTGIGIPRLQRDRVFERFYRVDSSRTGRKNGTGLGLSIVKHAVKIHNGNIKISSSEGEWTKVTVNFPIEK